MADYVLEGPKWGTAPVGADGGTVSWSFANPANGHRFYDWDAPITGEFQTEVENAFSRWQSVADIHFVEVADSPSVNIRLAFDAIDGSGGRIGETQYVYGSDNRFQAAEIRFDSNEGWHLQDRVEVSSGNASFFALALHEIGHAIGLGHYNVTPAIMNAIASPAITDLTPSDIDGISALYGFPAQGIPGNSLSVADFLNKPAGQTLGDLVDFDGNHLGAADSWVKIGQVDIQGDGDLEYILTNSTLGRWATLGPDQSGIIDLNNHGAGGDTRVVGIYIDPLVQQGVVQKNSDFDSQRRFQNDLQIGNINRILGAGDFDSDSLQEVYFGLADNTAVLHAYMHADGNIRYANYQTSSQAIDYLQSHGFGANVWGTWF